MPTITIGLGQIHPTLGDVEKNRAIVRDGPMLRSPRRSWVVKMLTTAGLTCRASLEKCWLVRTVGPFDGVASRHRRSAPSAGPTAATDAIRQKSGPNKMGLSLHGRITRAPSGID